MIPYQSVEKEKQLIESKIKRNRLREFSFTKENARNHIEEEPVIQR